jgi:TetR/AcrR family transcriptional regulator, cholesterol catabolism regulator
MDQQLKIIERARELIFCEGVRNVTIDGICKASGIERKVFYQNFSTKEDLIDKLLEHERLNFENIFEQYDFDGMNAIDILLIVGMEVQKRFKFLNPSMTFDLKNYFPEMYQKHIQDKYEFIFGKLTINIQKGISQGMYRNDISIELIARTWMSKVVDIHDPKLYNLEEYSFENFFSHLFDNFIETVANENGLEYYRKRKQFFSILNFRK